MFYILYNNADAYSCQKSECRSAEVAYREMQLKRAKQGTAQEFKKNT